MSDILERRKRARDKILGAPVQFKSIGVEVNGEYFAVREPTLGEKAAISKAASAGSDIGSGKVEFDLAQHQVTGLMSCVFIAEPVMEPVPTDGQPLPDGVQPAVRVAMEQLPAFDANGKTLLDPDGQPKLAMFPRVVSGFTPAERYFEPGDVARLVGQPGSSFVSSFLPIFQRLMANTKEDASKSVG